MAILVTAAGLAIAARFLYWRKETLQEQQEDGPDSRKSSEEDAKEYFI